MNKKIILSLSIIGVVAAIAVGGTVAYFSDTETSTGNTFTAGTIDISVNQMNPWKESFTLADMKPCYTDYIKFRIDNSGSDPNPVNIFKKVIVTNQETGAVSEPECTEQNGSWNGERCDWGQVEDNNDLASAIWYDLYVEVYNGQGQKIWWQTIYTDSDEMSIADIYGEGELQKAVFLGMIPAGGYMLVEQSYHLSPDTTNWAQGDEMTFDIEVMGEQLYGTAWFENKEGAEPWKLVLDDDINGTLEYEVKHPTFTYSFIGKAPLANTAYVLAAGYDGGSNVDTYLGEGTTDGDGNVAISGDVELNKDMKDVKVWLVPAVYWNYGTQQVKWTAWPTMVTEFLWETGMIWYEDTDL